jgi:exopolyphosphatase/guanosine-5'-triphosphate,3'-diphosphate pyrophosphatase
MRSSAIDVGSNTLRLLIGDIRDNMVSRIHSDRAITRLAEGMSDSGVLREENMRKSISVLKTFADVMSRYGVTRAKAVGTSALREAENSREFLERALRDSGIQIAVISGLREADLTAKGILMGIEETAGSLIIDIGGGSTEWIIPSAQGSRRTPECGSLSLGVVTLLERFISTDPPSHNEITALTRGIDAELLLLKQEISGRFPAFTTLVGTGGTITTLAALDLGLEEYDHEKVHLHVIPFENLSRMRNTLLSLPLARREHIAGLERERADLIIPGILLTIRFMEIFGFRAVTVSDYGLLEGLLKEIDDEDSF